MIRLCLHFYTVIINFFLFPHMKRMSSPPLPPVPDSNLSICLQNYTLTDNDGSVQWSTVSAIPSNEPGKRVWNFNVSGKLTKKSVKHVLIGNFENVNSFGYTISFEGPLQGTIVIRGKVLDASNYITYNYDQNKKEMTFEINHLDKRGLYILNLFINDSSCNKSIWGCKVGGTYLAWNSTGDICTDSNSTLSNVSSTGFSLTWTLPPSPSAPIIIYNQNNLVPNQLTITVNNTSSSNCCIGVYEGYSIYVDSGCQNIGTFSVAANSQTVIDIDSKNDTISGGTSCS